MLIALCIKEDGSGTLIAGNDGASATAHRRAIGARSGTSPIKGASDFHALLSLHSSTKSAGESIGNKGVGFRSVFASCERVVIWSRSSSGGWWCLQLKHPTEVPEHGDWSDNQVASFYNPQMDLVADDLALSKALGLNENP